MIVAITGGTGFIGNKLVQKHLAHGDEVRILSRRTPNEKNLLQPVQWIYGDLGGSGELRGLVDGADVLYHCAGEIRDTSRMEDVHVAGTRRLIEAAAGRIGRWVQLSSTGAYGQTREGLITEQTKLNPHNVYETTKVLSDMQVGAASLNGAFQHVILRPSIVYGANMPNQSLYSLISMIKRGWFFFIGKPGASANYVHVDNVASALMLCGSQPQANGKVYNLSDYRTIEQFVETIAQLLGKAIPKHRVPEMPVRALARLFERIPGMPLTSTRVDALTSRAIYSSGKIESELGYRHVLSMEEGLAELVNFWQKEHEGSWRNHR